MKLETGIGFAVLGLSIMFVALINSLFIFLIGPDGEGPQRVVDPRGLLIQEISVSGAPAYVLAGITFGLTRAYGSRTAGILLIIAGIVIMAGMSYAATLPAKIDKQYLVPGMTELPYVFIGGGAGVAGIGGYLLAKSRKKLRSISDDLQ